MNQSQPTPNWDGYQKPGPEVSQVANPFFPPGAGGKDVTYLVRVVNRVTSKGKTQKVVFIVERSCILLCTTKAIVKRFLPLVHLDSVVLQEVTADNVRTSQLYFATNVPSEPGLLINLVADGKNTLPPANLTNAEHLIRTVNAIRRRFTGTDLPVDDRRGRTVLPFFHFIQRLKKPGSYRSPRAKLQTWPEESRRLTSMSPVRAPAPSYQATPMQMPTVNSYDEESVALPPPLALGSVDGPADILGKTEGGTMFGITLPDGPQKSKENDLAAELERAKRETEEIKRNLEQKERENEQRELNIIERERQLEEARQREQHNREQHSKRLHEARVTFDELATLRDEQRKARQDLEEANTSLANIMLSTKQDKLEMTTAAKELSDKYSEREREVERREAEFKKREQRVQQMETEAEEVRNFVSRQQRRFSITWKESEYTVTADDGDEEETEGRVRRQFEQVEREQKFEQRQEERGPLPPTNTPHDPPVQPTMEAWSRRVQRIESSNASEPKSAPMTPIRICPPSSVNIDVWNKVTTPVLPQRIPVPEEAKNPTPVVPLPAGTPIVAKNPTPVVPVPAGTPIVVTPTVSGSAPPPRQAEWVPSFRREAVMASDADPDPDILEEGVTRRLQILSGRGGEPPRQNPLDSPRSPAAATKGHFTYISPLEESESEYDVLPVPKNGEQVRRHAQSNGKSQYWQGFMNEWSRMAYSFGTEDLIHDPGAVETFKYRIKAKPTQVLAYSNPYNGLLT